MALSARKPYTIQTYGRFAFVTGDNLHNKMQEAVLCLQALGLGSVSCKPLERAVLRVMCLQCWF